MLGVGVPSFGASAAWDRTVAAAEQEGKLVLAGPVIQPYREALLQFQTAFPKIALDYNAVTSPVFDARISSERRAHRNVTDVVVLGFSGAAFNRQIPAHWYDPLRPLIVDPDVLDDKRWLGGFNAGFLDSAKTYLYAFQAGKQNNVDIDRSVVPVAALGKLADLLDPRWRGKIAMLDPRIPGSGHLVTLLIDTLGADAAKRFLTEQRPVIAANNRQLSDWVAQGAYPITSGLSPSELAALQAQGLARQVRALELPPAQTAWTPGWGALGVLQGAPHPNATKVFVNWLLSAPAQRGWSERGFVNSRRTDVQPGLASSALSAQAFEQGVSFNTEANAKLAEQAYGLARDVLQ
ncbi:hypothetical protein A6456_29510 [Paraburkholderia tropica]|nr:hypothetical protein A6456_29510 [Paraburkholderia tropica]